MNFSIVFPTRSRVDLLEGLFRSLAATTADPTQVEVLPVCDDDDQVTIDAIPELEKIFPVKFLVRKRSKYLNQDYINYGSTKSIGKYIFILNDDVEFRIHDWDIKCMEALEKYIQDKPDGIVYGLTDDGMDNIRLSQKLQYSGFPIISRKAFDALGYAMHPHFRSWGADIHLYQVYNSVKRVCDLKKCVLAYHISPHTESRPPDEINKYVAQINNNANVTVGVDTAKLREIIGGKPNEPIRMVSQNVNRFSKPAPKIAKPPQLPEIKAPPRPKEIVQKPPPQAITPPAQPNQLPPTQPAPPQARTPPAQPSQLPPTQPAQMSPAAAQFVRRVNALRRT